MRPTVTRTAFVSLCVLASMGCNALDDLESGDSGPPPLLAISDEFDDESTIGDWTRVSEAEQWPWNPLETFDVGSTQLGHLTMVPKSSSWYLDKRAAFAFKLVSGNVAATTSVEVTNRAENGPPARFYSLAGLLVRTPRSISPETWAPGEEDFVYTSVGAVNPSQWWRMTMTTNASDSELITETGPGGEAELRVVRIDDVVLSLVRYPQGDWFVQARTWRPDFPDELQMGVAATTDWTDDNAIETYNTNGGAGTGPDLIASFDYVRFQAIALPADLEGVDLTDGDQVSDDELAYYFGTALDVD